MAHSKTHHPAYSTQPPSEPPTVCLVVAGDEGRRQRLAAAATKAGWQLVSCARAPEASAIAERTRLQLVILDLQREDDGHAGALGTLTESLAHRRDLLLVLCSASGNDAEEIWARQLGVWLYLPGLDVDEDLAALCGEARRLAKRVSSSAPSRQARSPEPNACCLPTATDRSPTRPP